MTSALEWNVGNSLRDWNRSRDLDLSFKWFTKLLLDLTLKLIYRISSGASWTFCFAKVKQVGSTPVTSQVSVALRLFLVWFYECRKFCGDDVNGAFIALLI